MSGDESKPPVWLRDPYLEWVARAVRRTLIVYEGVSR